MDKTLAWTQDWLIARYGHEVAALSAEEREYSAALLWLLKGDAAQRVVTAWHVGWGEAQAASGSDWLAPFSANFSR